MLDMLADIIIEAHWGIDREEINSQEDLKYFRLFLDELNIPHNCFLVSKNAGSWCFNENGKSLFCEFTKRKNDPPYSDIRAGIFSKEYIDIYAWIIDCVCSNLNALRTECGPNASSIYPTDIEVHACFWERLIEKLGFDYTILPGISIMLNITNDPDLHDLIQRTDLHDLIYINYQVVPEFKSLSLKWWGIMIEMLKIRIGEFKDLSHVMSDNYMERLPGFISHALSNFPIEPDYTQGRSDKKALLRQTERKSYNTALKNYILSMSNYIEQQQLNINSDIKSSEEAYKLAAALHNDNNK